MFVNKIVMQVKGHEERILRFECDPVCTLGEVFDALTVMRQHVVSQINAANSEDKREEPIECTSEGVCE